MSGLQDRRLLNKGTFGSPGYEALPNPAVYEIKSGAAGSASAPRSASEGPRRTPNRSRETPSRISTADSSRKPDACTGRADLGGPVPARKATRRHASARRGLSRGSARTLGGWGSPPPAAWTAPGKGFPVHPVGSGDSPHPWPDSDRPRDRGLWSLTARSAANYLVRINADLGIGCRAMRGAFIASWHRIVPARAAASMQSMRDANGFSDKLVAGGRITGYAWYLSAVTPRLEAGRRRQWPRPGISSTDCQAGSEAAEAAPGLVTPPGVADCIQGTVRLPAGES